jgi:fructose-1,6-bisphosphatase/inositol monophosphatase family enzyme
MKLDPGKNSTEVKDQLVNSALECLRRASQVHDTLGETGEELVQKNEFGETSLRADLECEAAILNFLREANVPIRVISEEHGQVDITENPQYLGILDGLDGSSVYKKERGRARYGTMFGIFDTTDPKYQDYLVSGIAEHLTKRIYIAQRNGGAFIIEGNKRTPIHSSGKTTLDSSTQIYVDEFFEINKKTFSEKLKGFKTSCSGSSSVYYADVAEGAADMALECTRKNNLEIAVAYGLETEACAVMVGLDGLSIADKKYLEFGQSEQLPIVTAATPELAQSLLEHLRASE